MDSKKTLKASKKPKRLGIAEMKPAARSKERARLKRVHEAQRLARKAAQAATTTKPKAKAKRAPKTAVEAATGAVIGNVAAEGAAW